MSDMLKDSHGRVLDYLRLAVTDRCNLRCFYCMPNEGIEFLKKSSILSYEEMLRLVNLLAEMGLKKVRLTGGEPFIRKDFMPFVRQLFKIQGLENISITTNGVLTAPYITELQNLGLKSINLSLDSLNRTRFHEITGSDDLPKVLNTLEELTKSTIKTKVNMVLMKEKNLADLDSIIGLSQAKNIEVRIIEEMPFNGSGKQHDTIHYHEIIERLHQSYPDMIELPFEPNATAKTYKIPGHAGTIGVIAAFTRNFCGSCNRLRITPKGELMTCLYAEPALLLRDLLRSDVSDSEIQKSIEAAIKHKAIDGHEAEKQRSHAIDSSMTSIGG